MKKILSFLCCLALMMSLLVVPSFAVEQTSESDVTAIASDSSVKPLATSQGLWYKEDLYFATPVTAVVTPESGSALNVWLKNTGTVKVTVYKDGLLGWSSVYSQTFSSGERDVNTVSSCNGKRYMVKFESPADGSLMSALIYQH